MNGFKMVAVAATVLSIASFAQAQGSAQPAANTTAAAPAAATSTAPMAEAAKAPSRPVKFELYHTTEMGMADVNRNQGTGLMTNYIGVKGTVAGKSLGIRQLFTADFSEKIQGEATPVRMSKTYVHLTDPKLFALQNGIEGTGILRVYLPTSEDERFYNKQQGSVRLYLITAKSIGKWDLDMTLLGQAFANTQDTFTYRDGSTKNNVAYYGYPSLNAGYNFTDTLALAQSIGSENQWYLGNRQPLRTFNSTTTVSWKALPQLTLNGNLSDDIRIDGAAKNDFTLGREEDITVSVEASMSL